MQSGHEVTIYTDGSCLSNPGSGGWAAILFYQDHRREISGGEFHTTNNRMELMAAIRAIEALRRPCEVILYSDSKYVIDGITKWIHKWKRTNQLVQDSKIKNVDLWTRLDQAVAQHSIKWHWVKSHSGIEYNDYVDALAKSNALTYQQ